MSIQEDFAQLERTLKTLTANFYRDDWSSDFAALGRLRAHLERDTERPPHPGFVASLHTAEPAPHGTEVTYTGCRFQVADPCNCDQARALERRVRDTQLKLELAEARAEEFYQFALHLFRLNKEQTEALFETFSARRRRPVSESPPEPPRR